jgi:division protein CdvB (Snf7/Vps24/ESCRT-III family)
MEDFMTRQEAKDLVLKKIETINSRFPHIETKRAVTQQVQELVDELFNDFDSQEERLNDKLSSAEQFLEELEDMPVEEHLVPSKHLDFIAKFAQPKTAPVTGRTIEG